MKRRFIHYNPVLKYRARRLRNHSTLPEVLLWQRLKRKQMRGYGFHRQKPLGYYIVDFFCKALMLAIEVDGSSHDSAEACVYDARRQARLERMGISFLRFRNGRVLHDIEGVLREIEQWIEAFEAQV